MKTSKHQIFPDNKDKNSLAHSSDESICVFEMPALNKEFHTRGQESIAHLWLQPIKDRDVAPDTKTSGS